MKNLVLSIGLAVGLSVHATDVQPNPSAPGNLGASTNQFPNAYLGNINAGQITGPATNQIAAAAALAAFNATNGITGGNPNAVTNTQSGVSLAGTFTGNHAGDGGQLSNLTYPIWNVIVLGDSLSVSNSSSAGVSYPSVLSSLGFNVLTNGGFPGLTSGSVAGPELDTIGKYFYTTTGQRTVGILWAGKNDENTIPADLVTLTNTANGIITNLTVGLFKLWAVGADAVLVTIPHTAFPPAGPYTFTNTEPVTFFVNQWITNLPSQTNLLMGHKVAIADVASLYPQTTYTNSNGTLNTNTTPDGEHFSQYAMTNVAYCIASAITNSWIWKQPFPSVAGNLGGYFSDGAVPIIFPSGSGIQTRVPGQNIVKWMFGSIGQPGYFEDAYWDQTPGLQDIIGTAWISSIDENSLATSGFRMENHTRQYQLFFDTSDLCGIFGGATNYDKSLSYFGYPSLSWRGSVMLQSIPYQWYPSTCPPLQVALHDEWGVFKIGVNYNGTPGVFAFDGQTALATNLAAGQNITAGNNIVAGGTISGNHVGNGSGLTNIPPSGVTNSPGFWAAAPGGSSTNGLATTAYVTSAINTATNGLTPTNGLATVPFVLAMGVNNTNDDLVIGANATNYVKVSTNGFVGANITNGLATTAYVASATNGMLTSLFVFATNSFTGALFQGQASPFVITNAFTGFSGLTGFAASGQSRGYLDIIASANITITNPACWYTSDGLVTRTLTNGNCMEIEVSCVPGIYTNALFSQNHHN